jgi:biopolymer transport protein ExbD
MSKKTRDNGAVVADIPISSMIDIIFLLIIFFVVTAAMDKEVQDAEVLLANAPHGKPIKKVDPRSVTINVRMNGDITLAGRVVSVSTVSDVLRIAAHQYGPDIPIIVRADERTYHGFVAKVMAAVTKTKLYKVKFQAIKGD